MPRHYSEETFIRHFKDAIEQILKTDASDVKRIRNLLSNCGHPYDYARLGHPLSSIYEFFMAQKLGADKVITFASKTKPFLSVIEARRDQTLPVTIYCDGELPISQYRKTLLMSKSVHLFENWANPIPHTEHGITIFAHTNTKSEAPKNINIDAITYGVNEGGLLAIYNTDNISKKDIQIIRKRSASALLAENCLRELQKMFDIQPTPLANIQAQECDKKIAELFPNVPENNINYYCTGLAAEAAVFIAGGEYLYNNEHAVRFFHASNGYGGTDQLINELLPNQGAFKPIALTVLKKDDLGNDVPLIDQFIDELNREIAPAILFVETPTNPQLQMHNFNKLSGALREYKARTGHTVPVFVDTTMAPVYDFFSQDFSSDWPYLIVSSGSKYLTKGKTTLGVAFCSAHADAINILGIAREYGRYTDTHAKSHQLNRLYHGLSDLQTRMVHIVKNTESIATHLKSEMQKRGLDFTIYTMTPQQIDHGLSTGIISFYLPPVETKNEQNLTDNFIAFLLENAPKSVRSRVSYGQSSGNGKADFIYAINPEESTQGSLSATVKEAQKKNNVQICRLSIPQHCDTKAFNQVISQFLDLTYIQ